jgi:5-methyltetrahydrofolate--homocysteine methyltransferase
MKILEDIKLDIPDDIGKDFLTRLMGGVLIPKMEELLDLNRKACLDSIDPKGMYEVFDINRIDGDDVYFKTGNVFTGPNISKILRGSEISIIYIFTLGPAVDKVIKKTNEKGDSLAVIIMDAITTNMLECLGQYMAESIKKDGIREKNWASTCSYSPGQYKWTIEEQKEIFSMVDGSKIGVNLNKSYLMIPFKSVSGVYGFGHEDKIDRTRVACDLCPRENCIGRR